MTAPGAATPSAPRITLSLHACLGMRPRARLPTHPPETGAVEMKTSSSGCLRPHVVPRQPPSATRELFAPWPLFLLSTGCGHIDGCPPLIKCSVASFILRSCSVTVPFQRSDKWSAGAPAARAWQGGFPLVPGSDTPSPERRARLPPGLGCLLLQRISHLLGPPLRPPTSAGLGRGLEALAPQRPSRVGGTALEMQARLAPGCGPQGLAGAVPRGWGMFS